MKAGLVLLLLGLVYQVRGHGMLMEPPNRSSMWRFGYPTPPNYDDNQLYCGAVHQDESISKCGICGDPMSQSRPRDNENGGKYGLGIITRTYGPGSVIPIMVKLSANHYGKFQFSLCNLDNSPEEESCYKPVPLENGQLYYDVPHTGPGEFRYNLRLPSGVTCRHCSLRWTYRGANTWGNCADGSSGLGCGPQETFRGCADIAIGSGLNLKNVAKDTVDMVKNLNLSSGEYEKVLIEISNEIEAILESLED